MSGELPYHDRIREPAPDIPDYFVGMRLHGAVPVPFTVLWVNGVPDYTRVDQARWLQAVHRRLCAVCGRRLGWWVTFAGSEESVSARMFGDPAMHDECLRWSLEACPFLIRHEKLAIYVTRTFQAVRLRDGSMLVAAGRARSIEWLERPALESVAPSADNGQTAEGGMGGASR